MRLCVCSDIHGNQFAFRKFVEDIERKKFDQVIFLGDICGYYFGQQEIISYFLAHREIICLLGNHDQMLLEVWDGSPAERLISKYGDSYRSVHTKYKDEEVAFLRSLPHCYELQTDGLQLGFFHGGPDDYLNMRIYPDTQLKEFQNQKRYDYIFCGHTHHKLQKKIGDTILINPGSLGQQRDGKGTSYVEFNTVTGEVCYDVVEYDREALCLDVEQSESDPNMREKLKEVIYR